MDYETELKKQINNSQEIQYFIINNIIVFLNVNKD